MWKSFEKEFLSIHYSIFLLKYFQSLDDSYIKNSIEHLSKSELILIQWIHENR